MINFLWGIAGLIVGLFITAWFKVGQEKLAKHKITKAKNLKREIKDAYIFINDNYEAWHRSIAHYEGLIPNVEKEVLKFYRKNKSNSVDFFNRL